MDGAQDPEPHGIWRNLWPSLAAVGAIGVIVLSAVILSLNRGPTSGGGFHYAHFAGDGFSFDYPDDWEVISRHQHAGLHGPTVLAAVGLGDFDLGCTTTASATTCDSSPHWTVSQDGVVLAYRFGAWLGPVAPQPSPSLAPGDTWVQVGGRSAVLSRTNTSMAWHFPGAPEFIEARWGSESAEVAPGRVEMVIDTWQWDSAATPRSTVTPSASEGIGMGEIIRVAAGERVQSVPLNEDFAQAFAQAWTFTQDHPTDVGYPWLDPSSGELVLSAVSAHGETLLQAEIARFSVPVRIRQVTHSFAELQQIQEDVTHLYAEGVTDANLIYETSPDHRDNCTLITMSGESQPLLEALLQRFPADAIAVQVDPSRGPATTADG